jgi:hypothetical protein
MEIQRRIGNTEHYEAFGNNNRTSRQSNGYDIELENNWAKNIHNFLPKRFTVMHMYIARCSNCCIEDPKQIP